MNSPQVIRVVSSPLPLSSSPLQAMNFAPGATPIPFVVPQIVPISNSHVI
jgi:hypothetical protein